MSLVWSFWLWNFRIHLPWLLLSLWSSIGQAAIRCLLQCICKIFIVASRSWRWGSCWFYLRFWQIWPLSYQLEPTFDRCLHKCNFSGPLSLASQFSKELRSKSVCLTASIQTFGWKVNEYLGLSWRLYPISIEEVLKHGICRHVQALFVKFFNLIRSLPWTKIDTWTGTPHLHRLSAWSITCLDLRLCPIYLQSLVRSHFLFPRSKVGRQVGKIAWYPLQEPGLE